MSPHNVFVYKGVQGDGKWGWADSAGTQLPSKRDLVSRCRAIYGLATNEKYARDIKHFLLALKSTKRLVKVTLSQ